MKTIKTNVKQRKQCKTIKTNVKQWKQCKTNVKQRK